MYDNIASTYLKLLKEQQLQFDFNESEKHPMIDVDGIQKHRNNSEDQPIHPSDEGIKNFHRWFGNSTTIDEHGRPKIFYHGTASTENDSGNEALRQFNPYYNLKSKQLYGAGVYTTENPDIASEYSDAYREHSKNTHPNVLPLYVKAEHPLDINAPIHKSLPHLQKVKGAKTPGGKVKQYIDEYARAGVLPLLNHLSRAYENDTGRYADFDKYQDYAKNTAIDAINEKVRKGEIKTGNDLFNLHAKTYYHGLNETGTHNASTRALRLLGFDSIKHIGGRNLGTIDHPVVIALDSANVKSALGNKGTFDPRKSELNESIEHPMIDVDGIQKHRHNSEGKPIHPTEEGIRNFHRWFKNGLTDEHGRPQVFYHGTKHQDPIKTFQIGGLKNSELTGDAYGVGTYLTTSKGEASAYTIGKDNVGGVYPLYAKGNILDIDAKELPLEHQKKLTDYANENLLPSDKSRFQSDSRKTAIFNQDELEDAKEFFDTHMKNYEYFGDGYDRNKPQVEQHGDKFHINYIDYNSPVKIKTGNDAHNLLKSVGFDNLKHAGFDGLSMNRQGGAKWLIMHSPDSNLKSALGNKGTFNNSNLLSENVNHPMIDVDDESKHRTNSQGKLIHYNEEGIKNFHRWFGNSHTVDEHGRPLVMYHGTGRDLTRFKRMSWVSHEPHLANEYADYRGAWSAGNSNVVPVYAKSNKPFDADALPSGSVTIGQFFSELLKQSSHEHSVELKSHMDSLKAGAREEESGPYYSAKDFWHEPNVHFGSDGENIIHNALKTAGFDSINYTEDGHKTLGLLRPNQLKSAIGNNGKFSTEKHQIVESMQEFDHLIVSVLQQYNKPMNLNDLAEKVKEINPALFANKNVHDRLSRQLHRLNDWDGQNSKYKYATVNGKVTVELNPLYRGK